MTTTQVVCPVCKILVEINDGKVQEHSRCRGSGRRVDAAILRLTERMRMKWNQEEARRRAYESQE